jgi:hypothetical protein
MEMVAGGITSPCWVVLSACFLLVFREWRATQAEQVVEQWMALPLDECLQQGSGNPEQG